MIEYTIEILPRMMKVHEKKLSRARLYMVGSNVKVYIHGKKGSVNKETLAHQGMTIFQSCNIPLMQVRFAGRGEK